jgi:hypothetical protein
MFGPTSQVIEPRVFLEGLAMGESPRWHDGRLWFSNKPTPIFTGGVKEWVTWVTTPMTKTRGDGRSREGRA